MHSGGAPHPTRGVKEGFPEEVGLMLSVQAEVGEGTPQWKGRERDK